MISPWKKCAISQVAHASSEGLCAIRIILLDFNISKILWYKVVLSLLQSDPHFPQQWHTHTHPTHSQFTLANKHSNHNEVKMYIHQSLKVDINSSQCLTIQRDRSSIIIVLKLTTCIPYSKSRYQEKCWNRKKQLTLSKINIQFD